MMIGKTAVFGIVKDKSCLENTVTDLKAENFSNNDISVLLSDDHGTKDFAYEKHTKAPEGAATGAGTGIILGGALGWLVGVGLLAIPGVGPFIAAGPIMAALAGAGVGSVVGGLGGALVGMGIPEFEAKRYADKLSGGRILISVHCNDSIEVRRAKEILHRCGAEDISSAREASTSDRQEAKFRSSAAPLPRTDSIPGQDTIRL